MRFKPLGSRVLVSVMNETTSGSIILPTGSSDLTQRKGEVVALPENEEITSSLKLGDIIMFENIGVDMSLDGKDYKLLHIEYIQGIVSPKGL